MDPSFLTPPALVSPRRRPRSSKCRLHPSLSANPVPRPRLSAPEQIILRPAHHDSVVLEASQIDLTHNELTSYIAALRRQRLSLLLADLVSRIRIEKSLAASTILATLLTNVDRKSAQLIDVEDPKLRAEIRSLLWDVRVALEPFEPSEWLRTSLEVSRSSLLHIPKPISEEKARAEMYALMVENVLLEELRSLRVLERQMQAAVTRHHPGKAKEALESAAEASALLGLDDYRVRGKKRLADAVMFVKEELNHIHAEAIEAIEVLHHSLMKSLETDLEARRPAGKAMLLRPRMDDIPNFAVVSGRILRGGQPSARGVAWLEQCGVERVIDLRGSDRQNQWKAPKVRGMEVYNLPIEDFCTPSVDQVHEFLQLVEGGRRVFVHCKAGIGRTGTMIACWRIWGGLGVERALGMERLYTEGGGGLKQEQFVRDFAANVEQERVESMKGNAVRVTDPSQNGYHKNGSSE